MKRLIRALLRLHPKLPTLQAARRPQASLRWKRNQNEALAPHLHRIPLLGTMHARGFVFAFMLLAATAFGQISSFPPQGGGGSSLTPAGSAGAAQCNGGGSPAVLAACPAFPITFVQESAPILVSNASSLVVTFPQATAASGNTAWMICAFDGGTVTMPSGWTVDINQAGGFNRLAVLHKATAGETSATFTFGSSQPGGCYFFEQTGTHALDQSSPGNNASVVQNQNLPSITPTANSVVFALAAVTPNNAPGTPIHSQTSINPNWRRLDVGHDIGRSLVGFMMTIPAANVVTKPPQLSVQGAMFSSSGIAYATFSIL